VVGVAVGAAVGVQFLSAAFANISTETVIQTILTDKPPAFVATMQIAQSFLPTVGAMALLILVGGLVHRLLL